MNIKPNTYEFAVQNQAGKYRVNVNLTFGFEKKPNLFNRLMTRILLGWVWEDSKP